MGVATLSNPLSWDVIQLIKALISGDVTLENWNCSHNGHPMPAPTTAEFKTHGLTNPIDIKFVFKEKKEDTSDHTLVGSRTPFGSGGETITFDGTNKPFPANHIAFHIHVVGALPPLLPIRLEVRFVMPTASVKDDHYRFDASLKA